MKKQITLLFSLFTFSLTALAQLNAGLVAHYPFNGNANDSGSNSLDASVNKGIPATDRFGNPNAAYKFVGDSSTYISVSHSSLLNLTGDKTVSLWYKIDTLPNQLFPSLIHKEGQFDFYPTFAVQFNEEAGYNTRNRFKVGFFFGATSDNYLLSTTQAYPSNLNQWIHIVATYSQTTGYSKIYFNGTLSDSVYVGIKTSYTSTQPMQIARGTSYGGYSQNYFKGYLDDIRLYNRALSALEIDSVFNEADTTSAPTSVKSVTALKTVTIYPNPAQKSLTIGSLNGEAIARIYDITGKLCLDVVLKERENTIAVDYLKAGIYTLQLSNASGSATHKILIKE